MIVLILSTVLFSHIARSQNCEFTDGINPMLYLTPTLDEVAPSGTVIASLQHGAGTVQCSNVNPFFFTEYVSFTDDGENITFFLGQSFDDAIDNQIVKLTLSGNCELTCPDAERPAQLPVYIYVTPENNRKPEFSRESVELELQESMPVDLDFSYLFESDDGSLLTVVDRDCPFKPNGSVSFEIDPDNADRFQVLPPLHFPREECTDSIIYSPRISLKRRLVASEGDISFFLIAKDGGEPPKENRLPITIIVKPEDLRDPVFDYPYYTATIQHPEEVGILNILPGKIHAKDGDVKIGEVITYTIQDSYGLALSIVNEGDEGISINLTSSIGNEYTGRENAYVVIEASQTQQAWRRSTVVLIITLPSAITTSTPSTTSTDLTTQCPPCTTQASSTDTTTTCPDVTTPAGLPSVAFEKSQYFSKMSENSEIGSQVIVVNAISNTGESVRYFLDQTHEFFSIDEKTGEIVLATLITEGTYTFYAIAITSSANDRTQVNLYVVKDTIDGDAYFEFPLYSFQVNENYSGLIGHLKLINGPSYFTNLTWIDPPDMQGDFDVTADGWIILRTNLSQLSGSYIHLNISASDPVATETKPPVNTIVVIQVMDVNEPPEFDYDTATLIVGYPSRTYIDPLVAMPLFTVQAKDPDMGDNGKLIYFLDSPENEFDGNFNIDSNKGTLYFKDISSLTDEYDITVWVKDRPGLVPENPLKIQVRSLDEGDICIINISGEEELDDRTINSDLEHILEYDQVVLLHKELLEKKSTLSNTQDNPGNFVYRAIFYAVNDKSFIKKDIILQSIKQQLDENPDKFSELKWRPDTDPNHIPKLPNYEPKSTKERLTSTINNLTVGVCVVGFLFGAAIISGVYVLWRYQIHRRTPVDKPDEQPDERNNAYVKTTPTTIILGNRQDNGILCADGNVEKQNPIDQVEIHDDTTLEKEANSLPSANYQKIILKTISNEQQESSEKKEGNNLEEKKPPNDTDLQKKQYPVSPSATKLLFKNINNKNEKSTEREEEDECVGPTQLATTKFLQADVYCPPSPGPQKSILKNANHKIQESSKNDPPAAPARIIEEKKEKDGGVKFNPTPEVISVASSGSLQWNPVAPVDGINVETDETNEDVEMEAL